MTPPSRLSASVRDTRGLSSVEYVVLLVLIVTSTVPLWRELALAVERKLRCAAESFDVQLQDKCAEQESGSTTHGAGVESGQLGAPSASGG